MTFGYYLVKVGGLGGGKGRLNPAVVLMDIRMPEVDGIEATRRILAANSAARILILTTFGLDEYVYEALCAGASGFGLKDDPPERSSLRSAPSLRETRFSRPQSPNA